MLGLQFKHQRTHKHYDTTSPFRSSGGHGPLAAAGSSRSLPLQKIASFAPHIRLVSGAQLVFPSTRHSQTPPMKRASFYLFLFATLILGSFHSRSAETTLSIDIPMSPPSWALLEREVIVTQTAACQEFFSRYFDERGYLLCVERWGGDDGPDDAIENVADWP